MLDACKRAFFIRRLAAIGNCLPVGPLALRRQFSLGVPYTLGRNASIFGYQGTQAIIGNDYALVRKMSNHSGENARHMKYCKKTLNHLW